MIQQVEDVHCPSAGDCGQGAEDGVRVAREARGDQVDDVAVRVHQRSAQGC